MKRVYRIALLLTAWLFAFQLSAQKSQIYDTPIASTAENPVWFFIQNPGSGRVLELSESGTNTVSLAVPLSHNSDRQLWRFELNGSDYTIFNKGRAGSFDASFDWDNSGTEVFTIVVDNGYKCTIKSSSSNYFYDAASAGGNTSASATKPTGNPGWWYFINAPAPSTAASPTWHHWKSLRGIAQTYHVLQSSTLKWTAAVNSSNADQQWRFEMGSIIENSICTKVQNKLYKKSGTPRFFYFRSKLEYFPTCGTSRLIPL